MNRDLLISTLFCKNTTYFKNDHIHCDKKHLHFGIIKTLHLIKHPKQKKQKNYY